MTFPSQRDAWLMWLLIAVTVFQFGAGVKAWADGAPIWASVVPFAVAGLIGWLILGTYYVVGDSDLRIRSGPFRWTIPLDDMDEIVPSRSPLSSPALSLDRLRINYRRGNKRRAIMISPAHRCDFLRQITLVRPVFETDGDSLRRRAT